MGWENVCVRIVGVTSICVGVGVDLEGLLAGKVRRSACVPER